MRDLFISYWVSLKNRAVLCTLSFRPLDKCTVITLIQYEKFQSVFCNFIVIALVWLTLLSLYTIVKSYNFLSNSCPELSNQLLSFSASKSGPATSIQILDTWWSSLDIMNDFKLISRMAFFRFGEINKSLFWVLSIFKKKI